MKEEQHHADAPNNSTPVDEAILAGLRDAERFYQGFQRQVDVDHLIKLVGDKLTAGEQPRRPENQD